MTSSASTTSWGLPENRASAIGGNRSVVAGRRIVVFVGPGNNGGDGLVAARYLAEWDADVAAYLLTPRDASDANLNAVRDLGVKVITAADDLASVALDEAIDNAELVVDALLGIGQHRPIAGELAVILERVQRAQERPSPPLVVAVDLPTGVDADSGSADAYSVRADMTVTFGLAKVGLYALPGSEYAGEAEIVDIGLPKAGERDVPVDLLSTAWVRIFGCRRDPRRATRGRSVACSSSQAPTASWGAARLTAEACDRAGAGLVTVACTSRLQSMIAPALPEATFLLLDEEPVADAIRGALPQCDVLLIGPGLGQSAATRALVGDLLGASSGARRGCVIDADGLNALAKSGSRERRYPGAVLLTPHPGEMARLPGWSTSECKRTG